VKEESVCVRIHVDFAYKKMTLTKATGLRDIGKHLFKSNINGKIKLVQFN
jgi:hypothetical protein